MSALGAIAFLFVFIALVLWACVAVGTRHDMPEPPEPSEPRPIRPSVDHYDLNMETGDITYHVVQTNGDRIRAMTDYDLADWIASVLTYHGSFVVDEYHVDCDKRCPLYKCCNDQPYDNIEDWLKIPVEEEVKDG